MQIKTLLSQCYPLKSFIYGKTYIDPNSTQKKIIVEIMPRSNSKPICSGCSKTAPGYDCSQKKRSFEFVPMWGFAVFFLYALRRVDCSNCGVKTELVPWADKGCTLTKPYQLFLAHWAKKLSWKETAEAFASTWYKVHSSVKSVVEYGLKNRDLSEVISIGIDEVQWRCGHNYITLVYQIDDTRKRLLHVANKRTVKSLLSFFRMMGDQRNAKIQYVCSDMWKPYLKVIKKKIPQALHILDRFHIVANLNKAVNEVRAAEAKKMKQEGYEDLITHTKYCFLKNPENLTPKQETKLVDVLQYDLKSVKAYLLKESFQVLWTYSSPYWARWFLKKWCTRAMKSRLDPIKKFAKSMRKHEPLIMNYFKAKKSLSSGVVEGLNRKVNLTTRKAYGFRTLDGLETALYHTMGHLPEPELTHRFF